MNKEAVTGEEAAGWSGKKLWMFSNLILGINGERTRL